MMVFSDALEPCMKKAFFGSVLSAGAALVTGHFTLIPITAKFVTNFTFCLEDHYSEKRWNEAKGDLYETEIKDQTIGNFRDSLLSIDYHQLSGNRNTVLGTILDFSADVFRDSIYNWDSAKFESMRNYCISQDSEINISREEYSILRNILSDNQEIFISNILSEFFVEAAFRYLPYVRRINETPQQILIEISTLPNLPNGEKAAKVVEVLFKNAGRYATYRVIARVCGISYEYSNDLLRRLDRWVVRINKQTNKTS